MNFIQNLPGKFFAATLIIVLTADTRRCTANTRHPARLDHRRIRRSDRRRQRDADRRDRHSKEDHHERRRRLHVSPASRPASIRSSQSLPASHRPTAKKSKSPARGRSVDLTLKVTIEEKVTIAETPVSTEATNNANQTVIAGKDLDALPDDPDELAAALQALAGPSVGPNGGQIFIDGFTGGSLPSKDSIREIRINQNPFAAENDQPSARIDVLTRPGTDKFRGGASINFNDESLNSRNPFAINSSKRTPFQIRQYDVNLSGPLVAKKASFFFNFGRIETDDNELVRATVLDDNLNTVDFGQAFVVPRRNLFFSPRFDYAINTNHTLVVRYNYNRFRTDNQGIGGFTLPERGFNTVSTNQNIQLTETAILNRTTINETRFQFSHGRNEQIGNNSMCRRSMSVVRLAPAVRRSAIHSTMRKSWELNNFTAKQKGSHAIKFGGRIRHVQIDDTNESNFGGSWTFSGGFGLTSIRAVSTHAADAGAGLHAR